MGFGVDARASAEEWLSLGRDVDDCVWERYVVVGDWKDEGVLVCDQAELGGQGEEGDCCWACMVGVGSVAIVVGDG